MTKRTRLDELADYYDTHDTTAELESAEFEPAVPVAEPMVTYALRLPAPVLERLRAVAEARGEKVTTLMRSWLEERLVTEETDRPASVVDLGDLLSFLAERSRP
ncbi:MAG: CopG family antitoxin, partial [Nocardioidaceae bacterium]